MSLRVSPAGCRRTLNKTQHSGGMTLIEVLVTLVIISVGLLGVAAMQVATVRNNYDAFVRSQAAVLAGDMLDRMRANRAAALLGQYQAPLAEADSVTGTTTASRDINDWKTMLGAQLPQGLGAIVTNVNTGIVTITIQWGERNAPNPLQFRTSSQI